jgi:hypothetical protein
MWRGVDPEKVKSEWAEELGRYGMSVIRSAVAACMEQCKLPPTLPEFSALCRQYHRPEYAVRLPEPREPPPPGALEALQRFKLKRMP